MLITLIYILYLYKCIVFVSRKVQIMEYRKKGVKLLFTIEEVKFDNKYLLFLNPLSFLNPLLGFEINTKSKKFNKNTKKLNKDNRLLVSLLKKIIPATVILWLILFVILPFSLWYAHEGLVVLSLVFLYLVIGVLLIQIWTMKNKLKISSSKFKEIALEYILCPPFSVNVVRNISIYRLEEEGKII